MNRGIQHVQKPDCVLEPCHSHYCSRHSLSLVPSGRPDRPVVFLREFLPSTDSSLGAVLRALGRHESIHAQLKIPACERT